MHLSRALVEASNQVTITTTIITIIIITIFTINNNYYSLTLSAPIPELVPY